MRDEAAIRDAYRRADREIRVSESRIGAIVTLFLMPAGITLDYLIYPQHFQQFALWRLGYDVFLLGMIALHHTRPARRYIPALSFSWLFVAQAVICAMIYVTEGYQSSYYAGLNLAMLAVGILLPTSVPEAAAFCAATVGMYVLACLARAGAPIDFPVFYNNLYFLILTGVVSVTSVFLTSRRRYAAFRLSYELDERNRELAELDRTKSEFFANISHELRTPLTLILAPVEGMLQQRKALAPQLAEQLDIVRQNALRLLRLVNDLLDVIRLEEGRLELERRPIRFDLLLGSVVNAMEHLAQSRGIRLRGELNRMPQWVRGDRRALEKILFNLLSNALKFTEPGGLVSVSSRHETGELAVTVRDNGIGIGEQDLPYVFERFRQADSSATRRYAGTGLGLALVKDLAEQHGGQVAIRSRLGEGTEVTVWLPLMPAAEGAGQPEPGEEPELLTLADGYGSAPLPTVVPPPAAPTDDGRPTVLVVDDEDDMRRYLVELLSADYRVLQAADGARGLEAARAHRPDLVVLDLMLPEIDGLEVCRRLKGEADTRGIRIVLLTARADEQAKLTALNNGADDFLTKPFSGIEVLTRLTNLLRGAMLEHDLEHRNGELQRALRELRETQGQLVHSEKLNALGRLSAGLLHEINNPLNYALTALEVARQDPQVGADADLREILDDIGEGMQRIRSITAELRAFAYPAKDQHQPFVLAEAVASALQLTAHESRGVSIVDQVDPALRVVGSRTHITQVLVNLLTNAVRAVAAVAEQRPGEIRLSSAATDGRISLTVRDNGTGMAAEVLEHAFDPFYTTRDVGEGMGMGLSICQTIIRNHGGELTARSEAGAWTEFRFDLPAADLPPTPTEKPVLEHVADD